MSKPTSSYIICSTPRTGSTLLCSLLNSTNSAGVPESYFRSQDFDSRAAQWNIQQSDGSVDFRDYLDCVLESGTSSNGVFAVRVMWGTLDELLARLRSLGMRGDDCEVLECAFGSTKFVFIQRQDRLAQAISRLRAEQTNVWHIANRVDLDSGSAEVFYDRGRIEQFIDESTRHNQAWESWFTRHGVVPLPIVYEDLDRDGDAVARKVLEFIGQPAPARFEAANVRMADSLSLEWAERFRAETAHSA